MFDDRDSAIAALRQSVEIDPTYTRFLKTDPDLQQLRDDSRFLELISE